MAKHNRRFQTFFTAGLVAWALIGGGCARTVSETRGSETHFLDSCQSTCRAGLECANGQCTQSCTTDMQCRALDEVASCSALGQCQVTCEEDAKCAAVSFGLTCNDGQCGTSPKKSRVDAPETGPTASISEPTVDGGASTQPTQQGAPSAASEAPAVISAPPVPMPVGSQCAALCLDRTLFYVNFLIRNVPEGPLTVTLSDGSNVVDECTLVLNADSEPGSCTSTATLTYEPDCRGQADCPKGGRLEYLSSAYVMFTHSALLFSDKREIEWDVTVDPGRASLCGQSCNRASASVQTYACSKLQDACDPELGCGTYIQTLGQVTPCDPGADEIRFAGDACGERVVGFRGPSSGKIAFFEPNGEQTGWYSIDATGREACGGSPLWQCVNSEDVQNPANNSYNVCLYPPDAGADGGSGPL
jgi:hypothetical protein